jgi:RING finger/CHY zinc finger protein 1
MPCPHYIRRCSLVAKCCDRVFPCRLCHDEDEGGACDTMDRKAVTEVVCDLCGLRQPVAVRCAAQGCGVVFGTYACLKCRFFDDRHEEKKYFHCDECGICRVGGRENWEHCDKCGACVPHGHAPCVERNFDTDCAVCRDNLFHSVREVSVLHCGHAIHRQCLADMIVHSSSPIPRCPTCCKTVLKPGKDRDDWWARIASAIAETPMPPEVARKVIIFSLFGGDLGQKAATRPIVSGPPRKAKD